MRNVAVLAIALVLVSSAGAAAAPDALVLTGGTLQLVDRSGAVTASIPGVFGAADWSPDGARLAYVAESPSIRGLYVAAADGSGARLVAQQPAGEAWGAVLWVSPGEVALFSVAARSANWSIRLLPVDGGPERLLTDQASLNLPPALQPGGTLLAYSTAQSIRRAVVDVRTGTSQLLSPTISQLAWSPDGTLLAVPVGDGIQVLRPDGTGVRTVLPSRAIRQEVSAHSPAWSPDGTRISFTRRQLFPELQDRFGTPARTEVYSVGIDGTGLRRLTGVSGDVLFAGGSFGSSTASWWPDGSRLFFRRGGTLMTMNANGSCEAPWRGPVAAFTPVWRPGAVVGGPVDCSSVIIRLRTPLTEVGWRDVLPLTIAVRNDGTRVLRDLRLSLETSLGTLVVPAGACGQGRTIMCRLGDVDPGAELTVAATASFSRSGLATIRAAAVAEGGGDIDPEDDLASVAPYVSSCDLLGTWGADRLVGTSRGESICGRPGWDFIDGRGGNDDIDAGSGVDTVVGGPGRDMIDGGGGGDTIRVRDGARDVVDCGTETDVVLADRKDVLFNCERVSRG